jgi:hypothetical protein
MMGASLYPSSRITSTFLYTGRARPFHSCLISRAIHSQVGRGLRKMSKLPGKTLKQMVRWSGGPIAVYVGCVNDGDES